MIKRAFNITFALLLPICMLAQTQKNGGQQNVFVPISKYMEKGDVESLSAWFADNLEVAVLSPAANCSKSQAKQILKSFFTDNKPRSFEIVYKSGSYPLKYGVGKMDVGGNIYTVTVLVKTNENGNFIEQVKIELL